MAQVIYDNNELLIEFISEQIEIQSPNNFEEVHSWNFTYPYTNNVTSLSLQNINQYVDFYYMNDDGILVKYEVGSIINVTQLSKIYCKLKVTPPVSTSTSIFVSTFIFEGVEYSYNINLNMTFSKLTKVNGVPIYVEYDSTKPFDPTKGDLILDRNNTFPYWPQNYLGQYVEQFCPLAYGEIKSINYITGEYINSPNNYPEFPRFQGIGNYGFRVKKNNIDLISGNKEVLLYFRLSETNNVYEHKITIVDIAGVEPPTNSDPIKYYYDEVTKEIYISDKMNEHNPKSYFGMDKFKERYGDQITDFGSDQTLTVEGGNTITLSDTQALYVFYGNNKDMWGNVSKYKYNRYMHKPYRIYLVVDRGTANQDGKYSARISDAYVYSKPTLKNDDIGSFTMFDGIGDHGDLIFKGEMRMKLDKPSDGKKTWDYAIVNINRKKVGTNTWEPIELIEPVDNKIVLDFSTETLIPTFLKAKIPQGTVTGDKFNMSISVGMEPGNSTSIIKTALIVENYVFNLGTSNNQEGSTSAYFNNENLFTQDLDCHPDLNNVDTSRPNANIFELEYSNDIITPKNLEKVITKREKPSNINSFMYASTGMKNSRHEGSFVFSQNYNEFTNGDKNTFGKTPSIEIRRSYFAYYNAVHDLYPLVNGKMLFDIKYLVGPNGDISSPVMDDTTNTTLLNTFSKDSISDEVNIYADTTVDKEFKEINKRFEIKELGLKPYPIFYSQQSAKEYSRNIDFWGLKESLGGQNFKDYSFIATGNSGLSTPTRDYIGEVLSPDDVVSLDVDENDNPVPSPVIPYKNGITTLPPDVLGHLGADGNGISGKPLSNNYKYLFEHTVATTYISDIKYQNSTQKKQWFFWKKTVTTTGTYEDVGYYELWAWGRNRAVSNTYTNTSNKVDEDGNINPSFVGLVDKVYNIKNHQVFMNVYYSSGGSSTGYNVKSIDVTNEFTMLSSKTMDGKLEGNSVLIRFNNDNIENIMKSRGLSLTTKDQGGTLQFMTWTIKGEIDDSIVQGTEIQLQVKGEFAKMEPIANQNPQNEFFPKDTLLNPDSTALSKDMIRLVGGKKDESRSVKLETPTSKYWDFKRDGENISYNILYFKVKNANEAWGKRMMQKDIKYIPGESNLFQGGLEPDFISFPKIQNSWEMEIGDQIRFNNDEELSYNIIAVEGPKTQTNDTNELKIILDRDVNPTTDMNMFLVRRWKKERGNMIIESKFPYSNPPKEINTQGFIFPEYLSEEINDDPNKILKDLSEKGIIN